MPGGFHSFVLRLLRQDGRRRSFIRRLLRGRGVGGLRRYHRNLSALRRDGGRRQGLRRFVDRRRGLRHRFSARRGRPDLRHGFGTRTSRHGAGPSGVQAVPGGPAAPSLHADEEMEPEEENMEPADPPSPPCPVHGWACPPLAQPNNQVVEEAVPVAPMMPAAPAAPVMLAAPAAPSPPGSPDLPSPTPAHELQDAGAASSSAVFGLRLPAPNATRGDVFDNGASSSSALAPAPVRRIRFTVSGAVPQASRAGQRTGGWNPGVLGLSNGYSNGVSHGISLPGGSSSSDEEDGAVGSASRP